MAAANPTSLGSARGQDVTLDRLENQIDWYDRRSQKNQKNYKYLKVCTMVAAALIPALAGIGGMATVTAGLGVLIVVIEGLQQLNQYQANWIAYRSTCESLRHEKFLYLAKAGLYASANDPHALLAERIESLVSQEHAKWAAAQEQSTKAGSQGGGKTT
jgi:hypothetical protein